MTSGSRVGPYELLAQLGAGGMGEVWKARDTRLERTVAIKFSHAAFSDRFQREARAIGALNHPNIATLYDVGPDYLVMEYVEGGPVRPTDDTRKLLDLAIQIADGLATAHAAGLAHRDLKPDNILVTKAGRVKILDFGLAKQTAVPGEDEATLTVTQPGTVMGTVAYMSPEQARGEEVDVRSDQFSFGLILYELATGRRAFQRDSVPETLTAIIREDPEPLPDSVPAPLRWAIGTCLEKDPANRYDTTRGLHIELRRLRERLTESAETVPQPAHRQATAPPAGHWRRRAPWIAAALPAAGLLALAWVHFGETPPLPTAPVRFLLPAPAGIDPTGTFALSPDGRRLAFYAKGLRGVREIWLHDLRSAQSRRLEGADKSVGTPFSFSPDGRFLAVQQRFKLTRFDLSGGMPGDLATWKSQWGAVGTAKERS